MDSVSTQTLRRSRFGTSRRTQPVTLVALPFSAIKRLPIDHTRADQYGQCLGLLLKSLP